MLHFVYVGPSCFIPCNADVLENRIIRMFLAETRNCVVSLVMAPLPLGRVDGHHEV